MMQKFLALIARVLAVLMKRGGARAVEHPTQMQEATCALPSVQIASI